MSDETHQPKPLVCYVDNDSPANDYSKAAWRIISDCNSIPYIYENCGTSVRNSTLDKELRDHFYESDVVIIGFGLGREPTDHWAIKEIPIVVERLVARPRAALIYVLGGTDDQTNQKYATLPDGVKTVLDVDEFVAALAIDLRSALANQ